MTKVILNSDDVALLAKMPISYGSAPKLSNKAMMRSWVKLQRLHIIDGGPGYYYVRWGWLSLGQYKRVEDKRFGK